MIEVVDPLPGIGDHLHQCGDAAVCASVYQLLSGRYHHGLYQTVDTDYKLGRFLAENDFIPEAEELSDAAFEP